MKKYSLSFACCIFIFSLQAQNNQWTWTGGESNYTGYNFGTKGVADPMNLPDARFAAASWTDASGNLWIMGGSVSDNALWKYSPVTKIWTWVSGDSTAHRAVYGTRGVASPDNTPAAAGRLCWKDAAGKFWLYSGVLWKYDPIIGQWTWISEDTSSTKTVYGTKGIASPTNKPGNLPSYEWTDAAGNFWFYGRGVVWKYDVADDMWTWMQGDTAATKAVYGQRSIPNSVNTPGPRSGSSVWTDTAGKFWLFGGAGTVSTPYLFKSVYHYTGPMNDLWKYDPLTNQWTWMHGDTIAYTSGKGGAKGVPAPDYRPGYRSSATSWRDAAGNLWLFGGFQDWSYISQIPDINPVGDLWKYDPLTNQWAFYNYSSTLAFRDSFDVKGVESPYTLPAKRYAASGCTDNAGNLWMFGGRTFDMNGNLYYFPLNDLLKYNPNTSMWSLEQEHRGTSQLSTYGTKGVANAVNRPGPRFSAASCTDTAGNLWIFGGTGHNQSAQLFDFLNDLWKQDTAKRWIWMGNSTLSNSARQDAQMWVDTSGKIWVYGGIYLSSGSSDLWKMDPLTFQWTLANGNTNRRYGVQGQPAAANGPGNRSNAVTWTDKAGKLWMFGGNRYYSGYSNTEPNGASMNDTWKYDPVTGWWTWMSGDSTSGQPAVFGTRGVANVANKPGVRDGTASCLDREGNVWIFGGLRGSTKLLNDLWKYNPATNQWAWMSGDSAVNSNSIYGTRGVADAANKPGARYEAVAWMDTLGRLWLFGGAKTVNSVPYVDPGSNMNDLWCFDPATSVWTWVSDDSTINQNGWYGVLGVADSNNKPGARSRAVGYTDKAGNLRLIGGVGYGWKGRSLLNDEWTFSPFLASVLPVRFLDFSAATQGSESLLQWRASAAQDGSYYIVERSRDGILYDSIGTIRAVISSSSAVNIYFFTDSAPLPNTNYYRIRQKDPDGRFSYSKVVKLWVEHVGWNYVILPNPVQDELKVSFQLGRAAVMQLSVRDAAGHLLISRQQPVNGAGLVYTIQVKGLAPGTYFLSIADGKTILTKKFVKH